MGFVLTSGLKTLSSEPVLSEHFQVPAFGKLSLSLPCHVRLVSHDPNLPIADSSMIISLQSDSATSLRPGFQIAQYNSVISLTSDNVNKDDLCSITLPIKYDLDVSVCGEGSVSVEKFENSSVKIDTEHGECELRSVKTSALEVYSNGGDISIPTAIQGNITIVTSQQGHIGCHKVQGSDVSLRNEEGGVDIKAVYCQRCRLASHGAVHVNSLHAQALINTKAQVHIDSLDGAVHCKCGGAVNVNISRLSHSSSLHTTHGDVTLSLTGDNDINITASATGDITADSVPSCDISEDKHTARLHHSQEAPTLHLQGRGIHLKKLDWIQTLNLKT